MTRTDQLYSVSLWIGIIRRIFISSLPFFFFFVQPGIMLVDLLLLLFCAQPLSSLAVFLAPVRRDTTGVLLLPLLALFLSRCDLRLLLLVALLLLRLLLAHLARQRLLGAAALQHCDKVAAHHARRQMHHVWQRVARHVEVAEVEQRGAARHAQSPLRVDLALRLEHALRQNACCLDLVMGAQGRRDTLCQFAIIAIALTRKRSEGLPR